MAGTGTIIDRTGTTDSEILSALEPDQLTEAKHQRLPRRQLKRSEVILLWSLRLYLVFMIGVVVYQIWTGSR
jgi:hypothetical protein